jgi:ABC-type transport system involved in multi-copper enzyme maturation permease subunit
MLFGPIFSAELMTTGRRARYYGFRVLYAGLLFMMLWTAYQSHFGREQGLVSISRVASFAQEFFTSFSIIQLIAVLVLTPALTAGAVALERERRTIEYLFATDLRNHEIVLGKFAARLVVALCQILAGLPILSLAMLMGGIEPQKLAMMFLLALATTVALSAFGICVSVWTPRVRDAVGRTYLLLFALLFLPMTVYVAAPEVKEWVEPVARPLLATNPIVLWWGLMTPMGGLGGEAWPAVWTLVAGHAVFSLACILWAVAGVRRAHLKAAGAPAKSGRSSRRRRPVSDRPLLWKECHVDSGAAKQGVAGRVAMLLIVLAVIGLSAWQFFESIGATGGFGRNPIDFYLGYALPMGSFLASLGLLVVAARASATITSEKERDTWPSLLCTDLSPREVVWAKVFGNLYALRFLLVTPLLVYVPGVLLSPDFLWVCIFVPGTLLILGLFVTTLGVLFSLRSRNTLRAMAGALCIVIFLGGGYLLCCCMPLSIGGGGGFEELFLAPCMPFLLSAPGILYEISRQDMGANRAAELLVTHLLGTAAYGVAAAVLYLWIINGFDELSGRVSPWQRRPGEIPSGSAPGHPS